MNTNVLYIHLGAHRTGSTTIQKHLLAHHSHKVKVLTPRDFCTGPLRRLVGVTRRPMMGWQIRRLGDQLVKTVLHQPHSDLIISNENLLGPMIGRSRRFYPHVNQLAKMLLGVTQKIPVRALVTIRRQPEFIRSCYQFRVLKGELRSFTDFRLKYVLPPLDWNKVVCPLQQALGKNLVVVPAELGRSNPHEAQTIFTSFHRIFSAPMKRQNSAAAPLALLLLQHLRRNGTKIHKAPGRFSTAVLRWQQTGGTTTQLATHCTELLKIDDHRTLPAVEAALAQWRQNGPTIVDASPSWIEETATAHRELNRALFDLIGHPQWLPLWHPIKKPHS